MRSDLCLNSKFKTDKGEFLVVGVNFKNSERIGCTVIAASNWNHYLLNKTEGKFIPEERLVEAEKTGALTYLGEFNPKGRQAI